MRLTGDSSGLCPQCRQTKNLSEFIKLRVGGYCCYCRSCNRLNSAQTYHERKEFRRDALRAANKRSRRKVREDVLAGYGGQCQCCGEDRYEFLSIDHINGGGIRHIRSLGLKTQQQFYYWLRRNGYPEGFRVLCHNCNQSYGHYGYCPHQVEKNREEIKIVACGR